MTSVSSSGDGSTNYCFNSNYNYGVLERHCLIATKMVDLLGIYILIFFLHLLYNILNLVRNTKDINAVDEDGNSVIMLASLTRNFDAIRILLPAVVGLGVDINLRNQAGMSAFEILMEEEAKTNGILDVDFIMSFLEMGCDRSYRDSKGRTLLMKAITSNSIKLADVKTMLNYVQDVDAVCCQGYTALMYACNLAVGMTNANNWYYVAGISKKLADMNREDYSEIIDIILALIERGASIMPTESFNFGCIVNSLPEFHFKLCFLWLDFVKNNEDVQDVITHQVSKIKYFQDTMIC